MSNTGIAESNNQNVNELEATVKKAMSDFCYKQGMRVKDMCLSLEESAEDVNTGILTLECSAVVKS